MVVKEKCAWYEVLFNNFILDKSGFVHKLVF